MTILDHPLVDQVVFHPRPTDEPPDLVVDVGEDRLGCHVRRGHPDAGWVVYFHGNGELAAECRQYLDGLFGTANVCFAEYRGYGASTGRPALAAMLGDGQRIVDALGVPADKVVAFGRSLGSLYAAELARRLPRLAGLVLESGIADPLDLWPLDAAAAVGLDPAVVREAISEHFDQRAKLGGYFGPVRVLHAAGDRLVDRSHADRLHDWAAGADKRKVVFPHGDHNSVLPANLSEYVAEVRGFLRRVRAAP